METTPTEEAEGQAIVQVLAVVLERLVTTNSRRSASSSSSSELAQQEQTHFHAQRAPAIGILQYLERIHKYASCSKECFILALIYIDRLIARNDFLLTELNVHRVVITAVLLAAKFFDDAYYNNAYYAKVGGVLVEEMNNLECQFLFKIDFSLRVLPEVFEKYNAELISHSSALGLDRISQCTDEELLSSTPHQQFQPCEQGIGAFAEQFQSVAAVAEAPQAPIYPNAFLNPSLAASAVEGSSHYPLHGLQVSGQQASVGLDPEYLFPALAPQVSAQQQAQAPPSQDSIELDLIHKSNTAPAAAPQDASMTQQYNHNQALHHGPVAVPQAQTYCQAEQSSVKYNSNIAAMDGSHYPLQSDAMTHAPLYSQNTNYFNNGALQPTHQQPISQHHHSEITPSPPAQPPINMHGAPTAYAVNLASMAYLHHATTHQYPNPTDSALDLHQQQLMPSRPIAIGNHQDNNSGWSSNMLSLQRGTNSPA